ncbi:hypothetical protein LA080_016212 [Diaporthe eres]|nr:hypothetical protein LA080_016212 [Diaporthe eres]
MAMQQGKAKLYYTPFHETKAMCGDNDEASDLALESILAKPNTVRAQPGPPAHEPVPGYPPVRHVGARLRPEWLSCKEFQKVRSLQSRGKNVLEMAHAVDKNASQLRIYVDTYLKDTSSSQLHSASSTDSSDLTTNSTAGSRGSEDGLFPLNQEIMLPQQGMPDPSFLDQEEQERVWVMFQQNNTVRNMANRLHKNRQKLSQYINAYMRPKLLRLQAEERAAEDAATPTPITPLTGGISQFPPSSPVTLIAAAPGPSSSREPSLHENDNTGLHALFVPPLLFNPSAAVENEIHRMNDEASLLEIPKSASDEDSLFGDSPVDENHVGSSQLVSTHHEVESAQPTPRKRKRQFENNSETPRRFSKRLRHRSFP